MSFMDKVKFWKKDDDFSFDNSSSANSFNDSSFGDSSMSSNDPFASSSDPSSSGLPPDPMSGSSDDMFSDPMSGSSSDNFGTGSFGQSSTSSSQQFGTSSNTGSSQSSQDPFARPTPPPKSPSVGQSLAHNYIQQEQGHSVTPSPQSSQSTKPSSETEMVSLKLDAIRSELNVVSQRLMRLEQLVEAQNKKRGW